MSKRIGVIDRIVDDIAVIVANNNTEFEIPLGEIIGNVQEGDVVDLDSLKALKTRTDDRRKIAKSLIDDIYKD